MCVENNILCVLVTLFMEASMIDIKPIWECGCGYFLKCFSF
jgi:hypothetical protein